MSVTAPAEMCRLVVSGPGRQIEVAVPANVLVADLLPALLHHLGDNLADAGLAHRGWVLQRLGGPPLDEESTVALLGLQDGETVFLRPRADQLPPVDFDDLADGLATGVRTRSGLWRPEMIRWTALGAFVLVAGLGAVTLAMPGPPLARALCAAAVAVLALAGAFGLTRAGADRPFGLASAVTAIGFAGLAGMIAPDLTRDSSPLVVAGPQVFTASVSALVVAALAAVLVGWAGPLFAAVVSCALFAAVGSALTAFVGLDAGQSAAVVAVAATVATVRIPLVAFRLARIRLAPLPTEPEHLQEDIDPEPSEKLLERTAVADRYMTGLYAGAAAAVVGCLLLVAVSGGWAAWTLLGLVALVRLLALRTMTSAWHRLAHALPAVVGVAALTVISLAGAPSLFRLLAPVTLLPLAGALLFLLGRLLPDRRLMPYWARIGDVVQLTATVAMVPVLLAVLGAYAAARALAG
ncbi:type VII secretion integral membrane protein EccD [Micromonospora musae]|nr:type VII secretion integral membrane protein EccD [Micromonospora musae]